MSFKRRLVGLAVVPMLLTGGSVLLESGTAQAASCPQVKTQNNSTGVLTFSKGVTLSAGPSSVCGPEGMSVVSGATFYAWCGYKNAAGHAWIYGRVAGTQVEGWAWTGVLYAQSGVDNDVELC